jgi:hypothetical protein
MAKYFDASGALVEYEVPAQIYSMAAKANLSVPAYINREHPTDGKHGTAYDQMLASTGLVTLDSAAQRNHGIRPPTVAEIMDGGVNFLAASNTQGVGAPNGQQSRTLFPSAIIAYMEAALVKDYSTDADQFDKLIAQEISVATDTFEQPIVTMSGNGGPQSQRAARRAQLAPPASMLAFTTSDKIRKIPTYALGMEFSKEALRASTLDMVGLSVQRFLSVERDSWVNSYLSDVFAGDLDINTGSLSSLGYNATTVALDPAAVAGTITQKAWLKWLFRNRKYRKIDWVVCDLDSYLKIESRAGRPGLTAIDLTLPRVESQATVVNSLIGDVKVFIVDSAADGGPIPANTVMGLDSRYGLARVRNTSASVQAAETYALRQAEAFSLQFAEQVYRLNDSAFDTLTIS